MTLAAKSVTVHRLDLLGFDGNRFDLHIECGSGFYVRSLGRDIAAALRTEAAMTDLRRTRIGGFRVSRGVAPSGVTADTLPGLLSLDFAELNLPTLAVTDAQADDLRGGRFAAVEAAPGEYGVNDEFARPACVGTVGEDSTLRPSTTFPVPTV